ncbi:hypothetical protein C1646_15447 [Rhizophagus diaphanus]|nr:hypothetical protein C1646_15447 [Rhizophagus diaphanus] [Rhizophagus sp. MUCL 43196]
MVIHLKLGQKNVEWRSRNSINMLIDKKMYWFRWFSASKKLSEIREIFKFVAYKEIKEELRNHSEEEIKEFYGDQGWFFAKIILIKGKRFIYAYFVDQKKLEEAVINSLFTGHMEDVWIIPQKKKNFNTFISSGNDNPGLTQERISVGMSASSESKEKRGFEFIYKEKDMEEIVARAVEGHIKEKEMIKDNVNQSARELCKMMGLRLGTIDFSASNVNKDRQTQVLFEEIQKTNAKK